MFLKVKIRTRILIKNVKKKTKLIQKKNKKAILKLTNKCVVRVKLKGKRPETLKSVKEKHKTKNQTKKKLFSPFSDCTKEYKEFQKNKNKLVKILKIP